MNTSLYSEFSLYGVYVPTLLALMAIAYLIKTAVRTLLARTPFYAWIWHPALFNFSVWLLALGLVAVLMPGPGHD